MCSIKENYSLKKHNTFNIDVKTKFFAEFESVSQLQKIITKGIHDKERFFMLGGGSNILISEYFDGLIIKNKINGIIVVEESKENIIVEVGAGMIWHDFVIWSVSRNLSGIENLSLIPGTVGASPIQNIGAYGMEVKNTITKVTALEIATNELRTFTNSECEFKYRDSIFKNKLRNQYIITKVKFCLKKNPMNITSYGDVEEELKILELEPNPKNISTAIINIRNRKLPDPKILGNGGSFFKNPTISITQFEKLKKEFPEIVGYKISEKEIKVAAGWLIDNAGLKGYRKGDAGIHKDQALVLVNYRNASGKEIIALSKKIQKEIKNLYQITLEPEVMIL